MMAIPKPMLDGLGLAANVKVSLSVDQGRLTVEPHAKPRYRLADLLARCDASVAADPEAEEWDRSAPHGGEVI